MFLDRVAPYGLDPDQKHSYLSGQLQALLEHHEKMCAPYANIVEDWRKHDQTDSNQIEAYPFIPVTIFKEYDLRSTQGEVMSLQSSATTSGNASKIYVDKATRKRQTISANRVLSSFVGNEKRPYLVFDKESTVRGSASMGARGAAILSLAHLASEFHFVAKEEDGQLFLDVDALNGALQRIGQEPFIAYGFTYILYQMHQELARQERTIPVAHPDSMLLHSGGWKRLIDLAVDKGTFNRTISSVWGLREEQVIDFYGAVEQIGVPYPDCAEGYKHVPYWAEIIIRKSDTLEPAGIGETGLIQLLNCLPLSAPNHSVLTEDLGQLSLLDGCECRRRGKAFVFIGRAPRSETRGCSDVTRH